MPTVAQALAASCQGRRVGLPLLTLATSLRGQRALVCGLGSGLVQSFAAQGRCPTTPAIFPPTHSLLHIFKDLAQLAAADGFENAIKGRRDCDTDGQLLQHRPPSE